MPSPKKIWLILLSLTGLYVAASALVFFGVKYGWTNTAGLADPGRPTAAANPIWATNEEWATLAAALIKDRAVIEAAAAQVDLKPRLLAALIVPEQLRLFHTERAVFKQIFAPLKILGNQSQFSWGVAGFKQTTAEQVEVHLTDQQSPFYLGPEFENSLAFATANPNQERFERLVNERNHFYSYLYAGLFTRQIMAQWERSGWPIGDRPEILGTLFNIGFNNSHPKANPVMGGAAIEIAGTTYSFGRLTYEFYYSELLQEIFPR